MNDQPARKAQRPSFGGSGLSPLVRRLMGGAAVLIGLASLTWATPPKIYLVDLSDNFVLLHFDTDPNRTYTVQVRDSLTSGTWSNLTVVPALPFGQHWIASDIYTNRARRFYRLSVTP